MSVHASAEVEIHKTPSEVAQYMFDPTRESEWSQTTLKASASGSLEKGAMVTREIKMLDMQFTYTTQIVDYEEAAFLEMTAEEPYPINLRYELQMIPDGTLVQIEAEYQPNGFFNGGADALKEAIDSSLKDGLHTLKERLES